MIGSLRWKRSDSGQASSAPGTAPSVVSAAKPSDSLSENPWSASSVGTHDTKP